MSTDTRRFVVIGGGLAGLASAVWLAEAGRDVVLLERRGRLGGRTHAMRADQVDDVPDNGQHVIASGYHHLYRYLDSVGTREHLAFPKVSTLRWPEAARRRCRPRDSVRCAPCSVCTPTPVLVTGSGPHAPRSDWAGRRCASQPTWRT
ncbi:MULTISPECIES: FAD-dependent oxidoreductase [Mycolicibacterium]|uniref:FAD-dependent oxidoreductase n=1 Tax=Mycolicibacterium monacense TaxID=85693 RepID=UPI000B052BBA|nr:FAD-dependent oxidoreductase [Mycolicibacterium monacense]